MTRKELIYGVFSLALVAFMWFWAVPAPVAHSSTVAKTLLYNGVSHAYRVYTPSSYVPGIAVPVVLVFPGEAGDDESVESLSDLNVSADQYGFIAVYTNETSDVGFVSFLIARLDIDYTINRGKVYATGFSKGAVFVHQLGKELSNKIAAIAPVSGTLPKNLLQVTFPKAIPVIAFHGTADSVIPYIGGTILSVSSTALASVSDTMDKWARVNGCSVVPTATALADSVNSDQTTVDKVVYANCQSGKEALLYRINNGGHSWAGGKTSGGETSGRLSKDVNAGDIMWNVFKNYSLPAPAVSSFTTNPITILKGESSTLTWNVTNATACSIDQSVGSVSAASGANVKAVSPDSSTTYTLTCTNDVGSVSKTATITVTIPTAADVIGQKLSGWAWSENIGWIHFNNPPGGTIYGVTVLPDADNDGVTSFSGFAWAENLGAVTGDTLNWINFNPQGPYPASPTHGVQLDSNGVATGWARVENARAALEQGWDGWIKFSTGGSYGSGVTLNTSSCSFDGWAWGGDVVGWIHMSNASPAYKASVVCGAVQTTAVDTSGEAVVCASSPQPTISWTYQGSNGFLQTAYQIQIFTNSGYIGTPLLDTGRVPSNSSTYVVATNVLSFNTQYYYRVRAWSGNDFIGSPYKNGNFVTSGSRGPVPNFTWIVRTARQVTLTDTSTTGSGSSIISRQWSTSTPLIDADQVITAEFSQLPINVTLSVTDSNSLTCQTTKSISGRPVGLEFKEIKPE